MSGIGRTQATNSFADDFVSRDFVNGSFKETFDALVTSAGGVVTMSLEQSGGGDLNMQFSDGDTLLDTTPAVTIALTVGSDASPRANYIYIPIATKVLTLSIVGFPATEHIKVGYFFVPSAAYVASDGCYINQNWNDHLMGTNNEGHMLHMAERARRDGAYYFSGIDPNGNDQAAASSYFDYVGATESYFMSTAGIVYQMHQHATLAIDSRVGSGDIHVANWLGDNYHDIHNLADIVADSAGGALNNKYFNLFFFAVCNKTGEYSPMMCMLPSGSYSSASSAQNDVDGYDNLDMPRQFSLDSSTGVPVCRMTLRWSGGTNTLTHISTTDLRTGGITASGGGTGSLTNFADNQFTVFDEADITKIMAFDVGTDITTGTTRTYIVPDNDGTLALLDGVAGGQLLNGGVNAGDDLTLQSTSDATKGEIIANDDFKALANVGIGTAPSYPLHLSSASDDAVFMTMALNAAAAASTGMTYQFTTAGAGTDPITGLYCQMLAGTTTTGQAAALNLENNTTGAESIGGRMVVSGAATDNIGLLLSASNGTDQNMAFSAVSTLPVASSDTIVQAVKIEATTGGTSATCEPHTFYGTLGGTFTSAKDSHGMQFVNNVTNTGGGFTEGARFCTYTIANSCNKGLDLYAANGVKNYGFISTAESPSYGSCTDNYGGILIARNATVTNEAVRATSTLAAAAGSPVQGHYFKTTAAGSAKHWQRGIYSELADGYSGSGTTAAIYANNLNVNEGTGTDIGLLCEGNDYALHASSLGVGDGNILVDGSATIGGGYGSTGVTISATGNIQADGVLTIDGAATLNNDGGDADVTIKGQTDDNLLWTDASVDQVLIGTTGLAAPYFQAEKLEAFETLSGNSKVAYSFAADLGTSCTGGNYQSNLGVRCKATTTTVDTYYYSGDIECVMSADCTEGHGIGSYSSASVAAGGKVQTLHGIEAFAYTEGTGVSNAAVDTCASAYFHGPVKGEAGDTLTNAYAAYFAAPTHGDTLNYSIRAAGDVLFEGEIEGKAAYFDGCENNGAASTQYLDMNNGTIMAANRGYPMMRDGSITGVAGLVTVAGYAGAGTCEIQARISGSEVFKTSITIDGNGKKTNQTTQARGTDTFSAGDSLEIYFEKTSGTYSAGYPTGIIEVIYDD